MAQLLRLRREQLNTGTARLRPQLLKTELTQLDRRLRELLPRLTDATARMLLHQHRLVDSAGAQLTAFYRALEQQLERGYAIDDEEDGLEVRCLAVPFFTTRGEVVAALSVTGTVGTVVDQSIPPFVNLLQRASARICNYAEAREEHERMEPEMKA